MEADSKNVQQKREKTVLSRNLTIESEVWLLLIHEYLRNLLQTQNKNQEAKHTQLEALASLIGRNVVEVCTDDKLIKYRTTKDIINFIGVEVWSFLFLKKASSIVAKEDDVYMLIDTNFQFLKRIFPDDDKSREYVSFCTIFVARLLKVMLRTFLIEADILAETPDYVEYHFTIQVKGSLAP